MGAAAGEPGSVEVPHADQVIDFQATAVVLVLFVNAHLMLQ